MLSGSSSLQAATSTLAASFYTQKYHEVFQSNVQRTSKSSKTTTKKYKSSLPITPLL